MKVGAKSSDDDSLILFIYEAKCGRTKLPGILINISQENKNSTWSEKLKSNLINITQGGVLDKGLNSRCIRCLLVL